MSRSPWSVFIRGALASLPCSLATFSTTVSSTPGHFSAAKVAVSSKQLAASSKSRVVKNRYFQNSVLCSLFFVLCSLFFVLCSLFFVLCSLFSVLVFIPHLQPVQLLSYLIL